MITWVSSCRHPNLTFCNWIAVKKSVRKDKRMFIDDLAQEAVRLQPGNIT